jgi:pimeloyl-ACP methyl ester carboxylesterase
VGTHIVQRMALEVEGTGEAVVMLHGLGGTSNVYTPQMSVLGGRFRTIRPDFPGSGRSPASGSLSIQGFAEAVVRAMAVLGVASAHLVGHSMGTLVCLAIAVEHPGLVRSLALFGPLLGLADAARDGLRRRAGQARGEGMAEIAEAVIAGTLSADTRANRPVTVALVRELLMRQDPEGYARTCEGLAAAEAPDAAGIRCRTLLVTGDEDPIAPPGAARAIAGAIPGARTVTLARCGHWTTLERAVEASAALREFYFGRR